MLKEYDFGEGVRGKYVGRFEQGANVVHLALNVAEDLTDSESVDYADKTAKSLDKSESP